MAYFCRGTPRTRELPSCQTSGEPHVLSLLPAVRCSLETYTTCTAHTLCLAHAVRATHACAQCPTLPWLLLAPRVQMGGMVRALLSPLTPCV